MALLFVSAAPLADLRSKGKSRCPKRHRAHPPTAAATALEPLVRVRSNVPAVLVRGGNRMSFVNGMGTNAFSQAITEPVQTVFTSSIGRCVDLVTALQYEDFVLLLSSLPEGKLYDYLDRYIFPTDDVEIERYALGAAVEVMGARPGELQTPAELQALPAVFGTTVCERDIGAVKGSELKALEGDWVGNLGTVIEDNEEWAAARVQLGIPLLGTDITADQNPLEAGLWNWVSFEKGCYIGQETIARLNTYDGVKQVLCLMEFEGEVAVGGEIEGEEEGRKAGKLTSVSVKDGRCRALGYIRTKSGVSGVGSAVDVGGVKGIVMDSPFLKRGFEDRSMLTM